MPDYDLCKLSSRSFEQLVQSLTLTELTAPVQVFGDGPDGGREASFEGATAVPGAADVWDGYCIVQSKFRQRLTTTRADTAWLMKELKAELNAFVEPDSTRRLPKYYLLATNIALSNVPKTGGKAKARRLVLDSLAPLGLEDVAFWDYDIIRTLLDSHEEVRRSYSAWLTPGDVIKHLCDWLQSEQPDLQSVLQRFLQREFLLDEYVNLEQAGHSIDESIPVARVFVDLPVFEEPRHEPPDEDAIDSSTPLPEGFVAYLVQAAKDKLDPRSTRGTMPSGHLRRREPGRYVVIGGPGQGKTTLGQYACQLFRAAILLTSANPLPPEVNGPLSELQLACAEQALELPTARRFPFRVVLSEYAQEIALTDEGPVSLLSYLRRQFAKRVGVDVPQQTMERLLSGYPWVIVLDGLDEVPASANRADLLNEIRRFWIDASQLNADLLVIATTRPQGYNDDFSPAAYHHYWLAPLSTRRALNYAARLVRVRFKTNVDRANTVLTRLQRAVEHDATERLMRSPLQVTILATLVDKMGQPPQERWNLFREYYNVVYAREVERDIPAARLLRDHRADVDAIHRHVGLLLQTEAERRGGTEARLTINQLREVVEARLRGEGHDAQEIHALGSLLMEAAAQRLVFLVGLESDQIGFEVRSLQEFMAADALMDVYPDTASQRLRQIASVSSWRNVFLFAAGKCFAEWQYLRELVYTICAELNVDPTDELAHVERLGSYLALDLLDEGLARTQPKFNALFARLALELLSSPDGVAHSRLAIHYSDGTSALFEEVIVERLAKGSVNDARGPWRCLLLLDARSVDWARAAVNSYWPSAPAGVAELLRIALRLPVSADVASRLINEIPRLGPAGLESLDEDLDIGVRDFLMRYSAPSWIIELYETGARDPWRRGSHIWALAGGPTSRKMVQAGVVPIANTPRRAQQAISEKLRLIGSDRAWRDVMAIERFGGSLDARGLASSLELYGDSKDALIRSSAMPWPLQAAIHSLGSTRTLASLTESIEQGQLGTPHDWRRAEERWGRNGLSPEDFRYMSDDRLPFDENIATIGFPLAIVRLKASHDVQIVECVDHYLDVFDGLSEGSHNVARGVVADIVLFLLRVAAEIGEGSWPPALLEPVLAIHPQSGRSWIDAKFLVAIAFSSELTPEWTALLDRIGRTVDQVRPVRTSSDQLTRLLANAFRQTPEAYGLLPIIAAVGDGPGLDQLPPEQLRACVDASPTIARAVLELLVRKGVLTAADEKRLVDMVCHDASFEVKVAELLSNRGEAGEYEREEAFALAVRLRREAKKCGGEALSAWLREAVASRTSGFSDPETWKRLKLPEGIGRLAQVERRMR